MASENNASDPAPNGPKRRSARVAAMEQQPPKAKIAKPEPAKSKPVPKSGKKESNKAVAPTTATEPDGHESDDSCKSVILAAGSHDATPTPAQVSSSHEETTGRDSALPVTQENTLDPGQVLAVLESTQPAANVQSLVVDQSQEREDVQPVINNSQKRADVQAVVINESLTRPDVQHLVIFPELVSSEAIVPDLPRRPQPLRLVRHKAIMMTASTGRPPLQDPKPVTPLAQSTYDAPQDAQKSLPKHGQEPKADNSEDDDLVFEDGEVSDYEDDADAQSDGSWDGIDLDEYDLGNSTGSDEDDDDDNDDPLVISRPPIDEDDDHVATDLSRHVRVEQRVTDAPDHAAMVELGMLPASGAAVDRPSVHRFETMFRSFVHELTVECNNLARSRSSFMQSSEDGPCPVAVSVLVWVITNLRQRGEQAIADELLGYIPLATRSILGRPDLSPFDLLDLPSLVPELQLFGTYVNVPTTPNLNDAAALYVGSGTSPRGIVQRARQHLNACRRKTQSSDNTLHRRHIQKKDVSCNIRVLSLAAQGPHMQASQGMLEGILAGILNTFADVLPDEVVDHGCGVWSAKVSHGWVMKIRRNAAAACNEPFPDLRSISHGLNLMSPFRQGIRGGAMCGAGLPVPSVIKNCGICGLDVPDGFNGKWESISGKDVEKSQRWTTAIVPGKSGVPTISVICSGCWKARSEESKLGSIETWRQHPDRTESDIEADQRCGICKTPRGGEGTSKMVFRGKKLRCKTCYELWRQGVRRGLNETQIMEFVMRHSRKMRRNDASLLPSRTWSKRSGTTVSELEADAYCCRCGRPRSQSDIARTKWVYRGKKTLCHNCDLYIRLYAKNRGLHRSSVLKKVWEDREGAGMPPTAWEQDQGPNDFIETGLARLGLLPKRHLSATVRHQKRTKSEQEAHGKCFNCGATRPLDSKRWQFEGKMSVCRPCYNMLARRHHARHNAPGSVKDFIREVMESGTTFKLHQRLTSAARTKSDEAAHNTCWSCGKHFIFGPDLPRQSAVRYACKDTMCLQCYHEAQKKRKTEAKKAQCASLKGYIRQHREAGTSFEMRKHTSQEQKAVAEASPARTLVEPAPAEPVAPTSPAPAVSQNSRFPLASTVLEGFIPVQTPATGLLCAMHAMRLSIQHQIPGVQPPTVIELQELFRRFQTRPQASDPADAVGFGVDVWQFQNTENLTVDQAGWIFRTWARESGLSLRLGVVYQRQDGDHGMLPALLDDVDSDEVAASLTFLWVYADGRGDSELPNGDMGHWSGMKPRE